MSKNKEDPRLNAAMNMTSNVFMNSTTKFSNTGRTNAHNEVDQRLHKRVQEAIKSKSPQNKKLQIVKLSQLGTSSLWKGMDNVPQRNSKSPGKQQRLTSPVNQGSLSPQQRRYQPTNINNKVQKETEIKNTQNLQKKYLQRQHNRIGQNQLNDSRRHNQPKEVSGNIVSKNLLRNQISIKDDFDVKDKQSSRKRKYSNINQNANNPKSDPKLLQVKNNNKSMTQSRALSNQDKQKRVSFSPEKPKVISPQKKFITINSQVQHTKTSYLEVKNNKNTKKEEPYVYVPPTKRVVKQIKIQENQSDIPKSEKSPIKNSPPVQTKPLPYRSLSTQKEQVKPKLVIKAQKTNISIVQIRSNEYNRPKSKAQLINASQTQSKSLKKNVSTEYIYKPSISGGYAYQPPQKQQPNVVQKLQNTQKSEEKRKFQSPSKKSPVLVEKKPQFIVKTPRPVNNIIERTSQRPNPRQIASYSSISSPEKQKNTSTSKINIVKIQTTQTKISHTKIVVQTPIKTTVSLDKSSKQKSSNQIQPQTKVISRKKVQISAQQMKKDWSKIKNTLKYDTSISQASSPKKKIPQRQDVAMKMLAQVFLNASTRYFPGLSMLLKRGISKEQIEAIRSKSSQFKININSVQKKSPTKPQPKTERKLNWVQSPQKSKDKTNNRVYQGDVTATQYKIKKEQQKPIQVQKPQVKPQTKATPQKHTNIVSQSLQKNNRKITRDDFLINKNIKQPSQPSQKSKSIRQSPDVYKRQTSKKDVQQSKKQVEKMKSVVSIKNENKSNPFTSKKKEQESYVYKPPSVKKIQMKVQQTPKPTPVIVKPVQTAVVPTVKQQTTKIENITKPVVSRPEQVKKVQQPNQNFQQNSSKQLISSKSMTNIIQTPSKNNVADSKVSINKNIASPTQSRATINNNKSIPQISNNVSQKTINNSGKNNNASIKVQEKKSQATQVKKSIIKEQAPVVTPQKNNISQVINQSKSQTSIWGQNDTKKNPSQSTYVYQPPSKKEIKSHQTVEKSTQQPKTIPSSNNNQSLRSVQSEKIIKVVNNVKNNVQEKKPQPIMPKKEQKSITVNANVNNSTVIKHPIVNPKQQLPKQSLKQPSILSKKFITIISIILKKRLNLIQSYSFNKIHQYSQYKVELLKQVSFFFRTLNSFAHNYELINKRNSFNAIKKTIISSVNKIKDDRTVEVKNNFSSGRKQSAARIIFWLLKNKLSSYLQPIRANYLKIKNNGKTKQQVIDAIVRILSKRAFLNVKDSFKQIKRYRHQRQAVLQNFASLLSKIKYTAVKENFSSLVSKDIKQLGTEVKNAKLNPSGNTTINAKPTISITNQTQKTTKIISFSKSQQILPSHKNTITIAPQKEQNTQESSKVLKFTQAQQMKIENKKKQFERKENDLDKRKQSAQQQVNLLNRDKRAKTKKNAQLKLKMKELQNIVVQQVPLEKSKSKQHSLTEQQLIPILTHIYAYLFQDQSSKEIVIQRFLQDNQHFFQLPTNPALLNEWKILMKNIELKRLIKKYEGQQPREKKLNQIVNQENLLMGKLLRSFIRQRYIWQWVNIIANQ